MAYMEQLQGGLKYLAQASEAGRRSLDGVIGPVNGAISEITGAASELEGLPGVPAGVGEKLRRVMRGVNAAQKSPGTSGLGHVMSARRPPELVTTKSAP